MKSGKKEYIYIRNEIIMEQCLEIAGCTFEYDKLVEEKTQDEEYGRKYYR